MPGLWCAPAIFSALSRDNSLGYFSAVDIFRRYSRHSEGVLVTVGAVAAWFIGSTMVSVLISQVRPPKLKLASRDHNVPPALFGKRGGSGDSQS
jgi:hypothetical protein